MTGGGFGGCTVSMVRAESVERFGASLAAGYAARTGISPADPDLLAGRRRRHGFQPGGGELMNIARSGAIGAATATAAEARP